MKSPKAERCEMDLALYGKFESYVESYVDGSSFVPEEDVR